MNQIDEVEENIKDGVNEASKRKEYNKPEIIKLGALQRYTLGGTPGIGDSGNQFTENIPE